MKKLTFCIVLLFTFVLIYGCSDGAISGPWYPLDSFYYFFDEGEQYLDLNENPFIDTEEDSTSTFALDTSTAGYANIRDLIYKQGPIPTESVKIEEMINYFNYDYPAPTGDDVLSISSEIMDCPWNLEHKLVSIGVKAKEIEVTTKNNIVFLLDVSGSMGKTNKLPLMQAAFKLFVDNLSPEDTISIVTYASRDQVLLNGITGDRKQTINDIIDDLSAGGTTAGAAGIQTAYQIASQHFIQDGNNRVILGTDGDFNVGISDPDDLNAFISEKRDSRIYLSVLGFGRDNLHDSTMETLAQNGNGNYYYIDSVKEAEKVLVEEIGGTLYVVAEDTKTQVTFNPNYVQNYRLLGYENKQLRDEEFDDPDADAGEIGAGMVTTAVYEITPATPSDYASDLGENWMNVVIRYKDPEHGISNELTHFIDATSQNPAPSDDLLFISSLIEFALILRDSEYKGSSSIPNAIERIEQLDSVSSDEYKHEFLNLLEFYQRYHY